MHTLCTQHLSSKRDNNMWSLQKLRDAQPGGRALCGGQAGGALVEHACAGALEQRLRLRDVLRWTGTHRRQREPAALQQPPAGWTGHCW